MASRSSGAVSVSTSTTEDRVSRNCRAYSAEGGQQITITLITWMTGLYLSSLPGSILWQQPRASRLPVKPRRGWPCRRWRSKARLHVPAAPDVAGHSPRAETSPPPPRTWPRRRSIHVNLTRKCLNRFNYMPLQHHTYHPGFSFIFRKTGLEVFQQIFWERNFRKRTFIFNHWWHLTIILQGHRFVLFFNNNEEILFRLEV